MTEKVSLPGYCSDCNPQDFQEKPGETFECGKDEKGTAQPNSGLVAGFSGDSIQSSVINHRSHPHSSLIHCCPPQSSQ
jgi:hypothetical protein